MKTEPMTCKNCGEQVDVLDRHARFDPPHRVFYFCSAQKQTESNQMKTETKYTPTPWHFEKHKKYAVYETGGPGGSRERVDYEYNLIVREDGNDPYLRTPIAEVTISTEADANASFIVTACNSHDELVAFIQELLSECETVAKTDHLCLDHNTFATKARAALKKAGAL